MSKYTTELRWFVEQKNADNSFTPSNKGTRAIDERIENAREDVFDFAYPINEADKQRFEHNFIRHFYTREVGLETFALFQLKLCDELNLIIPKYNKLWDEATRYANLNLLDNVAVVTARRYTGTKSGTEGTVGSGTDNTTLGNTRTLNTEDRNVNTHNDQTGTDFLRKYSDTPQGTIQNLVDSKYLTNVTQETTDTDTAGGATDTLTKTGTIADSGTRNTTTSKREDVTRSETDGGNETVDRSGKDGGITYAEALLKARESYINIDQMLCDELEDLFMQVW